MKTWKLAKTEKLRKITKNMQTRWVFVISCFHVWFAKRGGLSKILHRLFLGFFSDFHGLRWVTRKFLAVVGKCFFEEGFFSFSPDLGFCSRADFQPWITEICIGIQISVQYFRWSLGGDIAVGRTAVQYRSVHQLAFTHTEHLPHRLKIIGPPWQPWCKTNT